MSLFIGAFKTLLYQPLFNALVLLYLYLPGHNFGAAIIVLTVLIRIASHPLMFQSIKSQKVLADLQPKIQEIQQKYKDDKEKQRKETIAVYQKEKINPLGGCLPLLIQFPIVVALYRVFWKGFQPDYLERYLYGFVPNHGAIDTTFFAGINLAQPSLILAVLAGILQFFQTKMLSPAAKGTVQKNNQMGQFSDMMQKQMLYFFPVFTVVILWRLPSALGLYWAVTAVFSIGQQFWAFKTIKTNA